MSAINPKFVTVNKVALVHLLQYAEGLEDEGLRHAVAHVKRSMLYTAECAEIERREECYCPARE